ncbi:MAG: 50S ribosomal protein L19 [Bacilli bacterium]
MNLIDKINMRQVRSDIPEFRVGDTVRVDVKIKEGKRERLQAFEGIVTSRKGGSVSESFTVRKKSGNVAINRVFPVNSPLLEKITVIKKGKVRRAKLNFLKNLKGNIKIKERN